MLPLAKVLRETRESLHLSLRAVARQTGISFTAVSRIEHGKDNPRLYTVMQLSDYLGLSLDEAVRETASVAPCRHCANTRVILDRIQRDLEKARGRK